MMREYPSKGKPETLYIYKMKVIVLWKKNDIKTDLLLMSQCVSEAVCLPSRCIINDHTWSSPQTCSGHISYTILLIYAGNNETLWLYANLCCFSLISEVNKTTPGIVSRSPECCVSPNILYTSSARERVYVCTSDCLK